VGDTISEVFEVDTRTSKECLANSRFKRELELLDVSDLASVRAVGARLAEVPVDVLVHNAGVVPGERVETRDGLELTLAIHVVGPCLLTRLLKPRLLESKDGGVIWLSSGGMYTRRLSLCDPNWEKRQPAEGADTVVWPAVCPGARASGGRFFFDREPRRTHLLSVTRKSRSDRRALWELCERLCETHR
jgi:hypothetical protein